MNQPFFAPRWLIEQAQAQNIDTTGFVVLDKLPPFGSTAPTATTEGVKRVLMRDGWRPYTNWM